MRDDEKLIDLHVETAVAARRRLGVSDPVPGNPDSCTACFAYFTVLMSI